MHTTVSVPNVLYQEDGESLYWNEPLACRFPWTSQLIFQYSDTPQQSTHVDLILKNLEHSKHHFVVSVNQLVSAEAVHAAEKVACDELQVHYANLVKSTKNVDALYQIEQTCGNDIRFQQVKTMAVAKRVDLEQVQQLSNQLEEAYWTNNLNLFNSAITNANLKYKQYMQNTICFFERERLILQKANNVDDKVVNVLCVHVDGKTCCNMVVMLNSN